MAPPVKKQQPSIKKTLQTRTASVEKDDIVIPESLHEYVDVRAHPASDGKSCKPTYNISTFARVWFREHSNFEDVLRDYWISKERRQSHPYEYHANKIIRMVTTIPLSQLEFPINTFRFKSFREEAIARMLLMYPGIKEKNDLQELLKFHNMHKLQLSTVSLSLDNDVHTDGLKFVREKQRSQNTEALPVYTRQSLSYYIRRQFYKRNGLTKDVYLVDLTVPELEEISRFRQVVLQMMSEDGYQEKKYKAYSVIALDVFKNDPELLLSQKGFAVKDPIVNLICNVMTIDQQAKAANDMESFFERTNAKRECRKLRDGTTREEFYDMYCRRNDHEKKLVPFHRLYYRKGSANASVTTTDKVTEVQFQSRVRFESNNRSPPPIESIDDSSEASNDTVRPSGPSSAAVMKGVNPVTVLQDKPAKIVQDKPAKIVQEKSVKVVQETPRVPQPQKPSREPAGISTKALQNRTKVELTLPSSSYSIPPMTQPTQVLPAPQLRLPQLFLELTTPTEETLQLATIMCQNRRFVTDVKHELGATYKLNFESLWKENKQSILVAYIKELWDKDLAKLKVMVEKWTTEHEAEELKLILMRRESQRSESSSTTSTSNQAHPVQQQSSSNDVELETGEVPLPGIIPIIKQEPQALQKNYTDVECLGTLIEEEIVIDDSLDIEDSLVEELQEEKETVNPFLCEINGGTSVAIITTQESQASNPNQYSDETLKRFEAFVPLSVHQKLADIKGKPQKENNKPSTSAGTKRKSTLASKQSSANKSRPSNLHYLDDEDSLEIDGNESLAFHLQQTTTDDFSVFLSPELINAVRYKNDDVGAEVNQLNPFTYARTTSGASEPPTDTSCFIVNLIRVVFEKSVKFDLFVNLPQYNLYNLVISGDSIRDLLNISDTEFESILNLLSFARKYEFITGNSRPSKLGHTSRQRIIQQLDLFFSSQIKFKSFSLNIGGDRFSCYGGNHSTNYNMNLTSALDPKTLKALHRCHIANKFLY